MLKKIFVFSLMALSCAVLSAEDVKDNAAARGGQALTADTAPNAEKPKVDKRTNTEKLSDADPVVRRNALIYLGAEKKKGSFTAIAKMLKDPDTEVRRSAVNALAISGDARSASTLIERFKAEGNTNVKINIVTALGELKSKAAIGMLKDMLKDPYPAFRNESVRALGKINEPETYPAIVAMLGDEAEGVRVMAANTVTKLQINAAVPELTKNLENQAGIVRRSAADALGVLGGPEVVQNLEKLLADADKSVAAAARNAIENIRKREASPKAAEQQPSQITEQKPAQAEEKEQPKKINKKSTKANK